MFMSCLLTQEFSRAAKQQFLNSKGLKNAYGVLVGTDAAVTWYAGRGKEQGGAALGPPEGM